MPLIFTDEDLMYLDKEHDDLLQSIKRLIDDKKVKGNTTFCRKCGHLMEYFTVGNAKLLQCGFCGNRVAEVIKL